MAEIAIGAFHQKHIAKLSGIATIGKLIGAATFAFDFACKAEPQLRLTNEIKSCIGECDIFFEHR